jgi:hypothetical protein
VTGKPTNSARFAVIAGTVLAAELATPEELNDIVDTLYAFASEDRQPPAPALSSVAGMVPIRPAW